MGWKEVEDMKQKVSDYIADRLAQEGICQVFTVTGGGAMHLNDSLGHHPGLSCLYQHHEQAAAMAAEAYARVDNRMAAVCVTSGYGCDECHYRSLVCVDGFHSDDCPVRAGAI